MDEDDFWSSLEFRAIDLERHTSLCVAFRRDAFVASFGDDARFVDECGARGERYVDWLRRRIVEHPDGHVHAWRDGALVGQVEMRVDGEPPRAYVNLFYVVPEARGTGVADELARFAVHYATQRGARVAHLRVSPTNARALRFYERHGWRDLGPDPERPFVHRMQLDLTSPR